MIDARTPLAWVRADNRAIIWWGADYPVHWEPGEGFAIYGDPAQADAVQVGVELAVNPDFASLHRFCLRQAQTNEDEAVRFDEDAVEWAQNPDPFKAKRAGGSRSNAAYCRERATEFRKWAKVIEGARTTESLRSALLECQDKLWVARCNSRDDTFRAAAERACDMAKEALKAGPPEAPLVTSEAALKQIVLDLITHRRAGDFDLMADDVANALWPHLRGAPSPQAWLGQMKALLDIPAAKRELRRYFEYGPGAGEPTADAPACDTCNDHGLIGGPVGQTAESLDFITETCPECTARYAAFRAGWRTNAALPADDPAYFERCAEADWQEYLKRGASGYDVHLDESAQELETEAALALSEDVPAVEAAADALHQIGRRYGWWTAMGLLDREGYRTPGDPIAQREFEGLVEEILAAGRVVHTDAYKAATEALEKCWGALNFILAFYDPGQRHLDTNAWKQAEAGGRRAHAHARTVLDELKVRPEDEENPWRSQAEWDRLLRLRDSFIVEEGLWASFTDRLEKLEQLARRG